MVLGANCRVGTAGCPAAPLTEPDLRASHPALWIDVSPCQAKLTGNLRKRVDHAPPVIQRTDLAVKPSVWICLGHSPPVAARPSALPVIGDPGGLPGAGSSPHQVPVQKARPLLLADHDSPQPTACVRVIPSDFVRPCFSTNPEIRDPTLEIFVQSFHAGPQRTPPASWSQLQNPGIELHLRLGG